MEEMISPYAVPVTVIVVYCVCYVLKSTFGEAVEKFIPLIAAGLGLACSVVSYVIGDVGGVQPIQVMAEGLVSGLAATGVWELYKNIGKADE